VVANVARLIQVLSIIYVGMGGAAVHYGGGKHAIVLQPENVFKILKYVIISFVPGLSSFMFPKFAVIILLAKLLNPSKMHIYFMWAISVLYFLMTAAMLTLNFAQCTPAAFQWGGVPEGTCMKRDPVVYYAMAVSIASVVFDLYLAIYPTVVLWQLHLNQKKKLALCASLGFGYW